MCKVQGFVVPHHVTNQAKPATQVPVSPCMTGFHAFCCFYCSARAFLCNVGHIELCGITDGHSLRPRLAVLASHATLDAALAGLLSWLLSTTVILRRRNIVRNQLGAHHPDPVFCLMHYGLLNTAHTVSVRSRDKVCTLRRPCHGNCVLSAPLLVPCTVVCASFARHWVISHMFITSCPHPQQHFKVWLV